MSLDLDEKRSLLMEWYSKERSIIGPELFANEDLRPVSLGTIVFVKRVYDWMKSAADSIVLERSGGLIGTRSYFMTKRGLGVFHSYFGAPAAAILLEALIATGIRSIVILGEAGSICPEIKPREILIPTFAVREEGTSYHYLPPGTIPKPSRNLVEKIERLLSSRSIFYKEGGVWTTDAMLRETRDKVLKYSSQGALAVEMECSALFSVAQYREAEIAALLVITDELHREEWKNTFSDPKVKETEKNVSEIIAKHWSELKEQT